MKEVLVLHLSDIHFLGSKEQNKIFNKYAELSNKINSYFSPHIKLIIIVITGDITNTGADEEYLQALSFFNLLTSKIKEEYTELIEVKYVVCPGNHDVNHNGGNQVRGMIVDSLLSKSSFELEDQTIEILCQPQKGYFDFVSKLTNNSCIQTADKLWMSLEFEVDGENLYFECLNLAACSQIQERQGYLFCPLILI